MMGILQNLFDELVVNHEPRVDEWFKKYTAFTNDIQALKSKLTNSEALLFDDTLYSDLSSMPKRTFEGLIDKLINERDNGIASRGQSLLSRNRLNELRDSPQFSHFLKRIICSPLDNELFLEFNNWWQSQPGFQHNRLLINRIFAACAPTKLSTVVDEGKFNIVYTWAQKEEFIHQIPPAQAGDSWLTRNIILMNVLQKVDRRGHAEEWLSLFPWLIFEHITTLNEGSVAAMPKKVLKNPGHASFTQGAFYDAVKSVGLTVEQSLSLTLCAALQAKPFLILTGLSGSGKTKLAQCFGVWLTTKTVFISCIFHYRLRHAIQSPEFLENYRVKSLSDDLLEIINLRGASGKVIPVPVAVLEEWYVALRDGVIDPDIDPKESRHKVGEVSNYQKYIHGFYTECKKIADLILAEDIRVTAEVCPQSCLLIPVGADWTSNENLLGYPDALRERGYRKPDNGALDLILRADADPEHPYFLILDEMNLSHVERYFADFLSAMESEMPIHLHDDTGEDWDGVPATLKIPRNLFVIGTVNVDETTYMFSPKVLDRANVIEFRVSPDEMVAFLSLSNSVKPNLEAIAGQGADYAQAFVAAATQKDIQIDEELRKKIAAVLMEFFPALQKAGAEFGYRTAHEICRFVYFHQQLSGEAWTFDAAMDAAVMQKLLPKLHGSKKKLGPVLAALIRLCLKPEACPENDPIADEVLVAANGKYPAALDKLKRMRQRLAEHGFTTFAEA